MTAVKEGSEMVIYVMQVVKIQIIHTLVQQLHLYILY